uniref:Reverse transcriptase domain-containing protein n=1 Tax=Panagrolaimus superbus TaxID=310955 RepID=A0A914Y6D5_9BILA
MGMELFIRAFLKEHIQDGFYTAETLTALAGYADDLAILANSTSSMSDMLNTAEKLAKTIGLPFKAKKCCILALEGGKIASPEYSLGGEKLKVLMKDETSPYLGVDVGYNIRGNPQKRLIEATKDLVKIRDSELMPSQKLDAINVFLVPRFAYFMQNTTPKIEELAEFDRAIAFAVKKICRLPVFGPALSYLYCPINFGGLGISNCVDEYMLQTISTVFKSLTNRDPKMRGFTVARLKRMAKIWSGLEATPEVLSNYLNCQRPEEMDQSKYYQYSHMDQFFKIQDYCSQHEKARIYGGIKF